MENPGTGSFRLEPLGKQHDRAGFSCGVDSLDIYLKTQATQDMRRMANAVFVLVSLAEPAEIAGYFTLCAYGLAPGTIPEEVRKLLPRYPVVSATLLGRLAVSRGTQGKGVGSMLLAAALRKAHDNAAIIGSTMVVVDAIDGRAAAFYRAYGFLPLPDSMRLILPMQTIAKSIHQ
jgi:GNAT superfamily N-acetyltransferase